MQRWTVDVPERSLAKGHLYCKTSIKLHQNRHSLNFNQNNSPLVACLILKINDVEWIREVRLKKKRTRKTGVGDWRITPSLTFGAGQADVLTATAVPPTPATFRVCSSPVCFCPVSNTFISVTARSVWKPFASDCLFMASRTSVLLAWISGCKR